LRPGDGGGRLLVHPETGLCLGLTPATVPGRFSPDVPGLDHLSFGVHDFQAQVDRLAGTVEHGQPTCMEEVGLTASVRGPDGIQLECTAAPDVSAGVLHHLRLTVEDVTASRRFYETLGWLRAYGGS
jgi:catechol 2,3-dioxygenase-like lactoylglutathione lyase family enzyme